MAETERAYNVLFLCTGNSARSIMAEAILARQGAGRFHAYSAGSHPQGAVHPRALALLRNLGHDVSALRSKSWDEFARAGAPRMDFVITVCDRAAAEMCPVWPGQPTSAHWGVPDPAAVEGRDGAIAAAFTDAYRVLTTRIGLLLSLPLASLDALALKRRLVSIGEAGAEAADGDIQDR